MNKQLNFFSNFFNDHGKPFVKYAIVGLSGTLIDLVSLYLLVEFFFLPVLLAASLAFILAVINNFILNKFWTFRHPSKNYKKLFIKFLIVSLVGLGLTLLSMYLLVYLLAIWYIAAKIITSVLVVAWNFLANRLWTFKTGAKVSGSEQTGPELSIIIPSYNEEERLGKTLTAIQEYLLGKDFSFEVIVVDDGSQDKTAIIAEMMKSRFVSLRVIRLPSNRGKGAAVRAGVEEATGRFILFTDADNSTPITELDKLWQAQKEHKADLVIGSRYLDSTSVKIKQPIYRIWLGRLGNKLINLFLLDDLVSDTQCGFKLFRSEAAKDIFSFQKVKRFGFDMEVLVVAKNLGYSLVEVPVDWLNSPNSRLRPIKDGLITLKDLLYIKLNLWAGRYNRG